MAGTQPPPPQEPQQPGWGNQPPPGQGQWGQPSPGQGQWGTPTPGYQPYPPPPRRRKWPWIVLVIVVVFIGGIIATIAGVTHEVTKTKTVVYQVTGDARSVTVTYSTWNGTTMATSQQDVTPPWTKQEGTSGLLSGGHLTVTVGAGGGTATCSVTVDNGTPRTASATGAFSSAVCDVS